ncbi:alanine racemase [Sporichthya brevicatena]|uniref:Alanine racemase n=1 Tax=Sporichthya brevicatena TaxID=171442 RepID=A0ABP3RN61_9ACTN
MSDSSPPLGNAQARVDLAAVRSNVVALRGHAGAAEVMAVVKADAYGHGMVPVARAAIAGGATWLGAAVLEEALGLRAAGIGPDDARVLCWLIAPGADLEPAVAADVDLSANAVWAVEQVAAAAESAGRTARLHLKIDSGLGRGGATAADWDDLVAAALKEQAAGRVQVVGIWSHLACSDEPGHPSIAAQVEAFTAAVRAAERAGVRPEVRHLANSAAVVNLPETHFDLVRPGIAAYGFSPIPELGDSAHFGLRPAMTLAARLLLTKAVPAGQGVSYGHTYVTDRPTRLGIVPIGYADGIPRTASSRGPMLVGGRRVAIAGRVCMDQVVLDLGDLDVAAGDEVLVFGPGDRGEPTVQEWADTIGTITYEVVTGIGARIPRVYTGA